MAKSKVLFVQTNEELSAYSSIVGGEYLVRVVSNTADIVPTLITMQPKLVFVDMNFDGEEVVDLISNIRKVVNYTDASVVVLSNTEERFAQTVLLNSGADDFWVLPIQKHLFLAKINATLRRFDCGCSSPKDAKSNRCDIIRIDNDRFTVEIAEHEFELSKKEFELLQLFAASPRKVFTRDAIRAELWTDKLAMNERTIDVHIKNLRNKIGDELIKTVKGVGYKLDCC